MNKTSRYSSLTFSLYRFFVDSISAWTSIGNVLLTFLVWDSHLFSITSINSRLHKSEHIRTVSLILLQKPILKIGLEVNYTIVSASPGIKKYLWGTSQKAQACILLSKHFLTNSFIPIVCRPGKMSHCMIVLWFLEPLFKGLWRQFMWLIHIFNILFWTFSSYMQRSKLVSFHFLAWHLLYGHEDYLVM